ncbi:TonB-dependent receptor [Solimonas soli]|uniref:TonB-dependent receptor n=1 Tax=Solimonas soli TaxID=413479 RepID=UPI0004AD3D2B|nr:TonB-dependent receptor [Solimonas soli]
MKNAMGLALTVGLALTGVQARAQMEAQDTAEPADLAAPQGDAAMPADGGIATSAVPEAEAAPTAGEARSGGSRMVEEVIVTAQKREEKLMSVPLSVQAFSPGALEARGVLSTTDLMKVTPGLDLGKQAGDFTSVYIRGIGSEAWLTSDPSVATYIDGVYYPFSPAVAQDLGGIERVEILKGPQGTLFGRNANGGAINVIVKEPDFNGKEITLSYTNSEGKDFMLNKARIFANLPLTTTLAANVSAYFSTDNTMWTDDSTIADHDIPPNKEASARVKLRWLPTEDIDWRLTVQGSKRDGTSTIAAPVSRTLLGNVTDLAYSQLLGGRDVVADAHRYEVHDDIPLYGDLQTFVANTTLIWNTPWFDTKLIGSDQYMSNPYNYDYDATEFPGASFHVRRHTAKVQEGEIQFLSNSGTPFSDWLTLTTGFFYFHNTQGFDPVTVTVGGLPLNNLQAAGIQLTQLDIVKTLLNQGLISNVLDLVTNNALPAYNLSNIGMVRTESWSYYLQAVVKLTDQLSLTLGERFQHERRGILESNTAITVAGIADPVVFNWTSARDASDTDDKGRALPLSDVTEGWKPKVALDYMFDDGTLLYASYQQALKAHSYNGFAFYLRPAYAPAEYMTAYEVGLKTTLFDNTTRFTTAVWRYDIDNLQTQAISLINGGALSISTAGSARSQGIEFDITSQLFPQTFDDLVLTLNGAYIDAIYTKYTNAQGHQMGTGLFIPGGQDYTGNRITRVPKYTASAALSKTWQVPGGPFEATVSGYYNDGFFYEASENPLYSQPRYALLGAHISYLYEPWKLRATIAGDNLTNKFYTAGELLLDWGANATLGPARTFSLRLDWTF